MGATELRTFSMVAANAAPAEERALDADSIRLFLQSQKDYISNEIEKPGSGFEEEMEGIELEKAGRDDEALVRFHIAIGKKLDAPGIQPNPHHLPYNNHQPQALNTTRGGRS